MGVRHNISKMLRAILRSAVPRARLYHKRANPFHAVLYPSLGPEAVSAASSPGFLAALGSKENGVLGTVPKVRSPRGMWECRRQQ